LIDFKEACAKKAGKNNNNTKLNKGVWKMRKITNKEVNERITLRINIDFMGKSNSICSLCGDETYHDLSCFHFFIEGSDSFVCEPCAKKKAPELAAIREEALFAIYMGKEDTLRYILGSLRALIRKPLDEMIVEAVEQIYRNEQNIVNNRLAQ
jgi:hypothetical protein